MNNAEVYKQYCAAIEKATGFKGKELSEAIAEANRRCYQVLFGSRNIRQRDMSEQQLQQLIEHRKLITSLMLAK